MVTERCGNIERASKQLGEIRANLLQYGPFHYEDQPMLSNLPDLAKLYLREAILEMLSAQNKLEWALEALGNAGTGDGPRIKARLETG